MMLRVRFGELGVDVRQGRYVEHTASDLVLYDGRARVIPLHTISEIEEIPESYPAGECAADLEEK